MDTFRYYIFLAFADLARLWRTTQNHVIIVSGICLPLFLLLGIKAGFIDEMSKELRESPTGRQVTFWPINDDLQVDSVTLDKIEENVPGVELVLPDIQRIVGVRSVNDPGKPSVETTLYPTAGNDPVQKALGIQPIGSAKEVVLSKTVQEALALKVGEEVVFEVTRIEGNVSEVYRTAPLVIKDFFDSGESNSNVGYSTVEFIDGLEAFIQGFAFEAVGLPALQRPYQANYSGYIAFMKGKLPTQDITTLTNSGFGVVDISTEETNQLYQVYNAFFDQLFTEEERQNWTVYDISVDSKQKGTLSHTPIDIKRTLITEDIHITPWAEPLFFQGDTEKYCCISMDIPRISFLRNTLLNPGLPFRGTEKKSVYFRQLKADVPTKGMELDIESGAKLRLFPTAVDPLERVYEEVAAIPEIEYENVKLSELSGTKIDELQFRIVSHGFQSGFRDSQLDRCEFNPELGFFVPTRPTIRYTRLRLYCDTINEVPTVADALIDNGYAILSEKDRIDEIQGTNDSLGLLVLVVGTGVIGFGVFTVISVLTDSTDRKKGTIGILRVMGVSKAGVFLIVLVRAALIGIIAGGLAIVVGYLIAAVLGERVSVSFQISHIGIVLGGAFCCAAGGSLLPAWKASNLDPFEAILEGKAG